MLKCWSRDIKDRPTFDMIHHFLLEQMESNIWLQKKRQTVENRVTLVSLCLYLTGRWSGLLSSLDCTVFKLRRPWQLLILLAMVWHTGPEDLIWLKNHLLFWIISWKYCERGFIRYPYTFGQNKWVKLWGTRSSLLGGIEGYQSLRALPLKNKFLEVKTSVF